MTDTPITAPPELLLGSSSKYRKQLLNRLGVAFSTASPDIDETQKPDESPQTLVTRLAEQKARALQTTHPKHLIIGSDQVACVNGEILGKPGTAERATEQLARLSGNTVQFFTGLVLLNSASNQLQIDMDTTDVEFRKLSSEEIAAYVKKEQPLDCAGSFKSEGLGVALFERIRTDDPAALIGLPLVKLCAMLRNEGLNPLTNPAD